MPWEYSENMCEKWLRQQGKFRTTKWKSKIVQVDRKVNQTDANDEGDDDATPHFTACRSTAHRSTLTCTSTESAHHERAQSCSLHISSHSHWLKFEPCPHSTQYHHHGHPCGCLFDLTSPFLPIRVLPVFLPLLHTDCERNGHDFTEFQNSSVPILFKIPAADQDVDDPTPGEMHTEAHKGQVDCSVRVGVSVTQLSSFLTFDRSGQLDGERMVDGSGQPDECNSSKTQIRTLLEEKRQTILAECHARVSHHELQAAQGEEERRLFQGQL